MESSKFTESVDKKLMKLIYKRLKCKNVDFNDH